jgi:hypothetical protein
LLQEFMTGINLKTGIIDSSLVEGRVISLSKPILGNSQGEQVLRLLPSLVKLNLIAMVT